MIRLLGIELSNVSEYDQEGSHSVETYMKRPKAGFLLQGARPTSKFVSVFLCPPVTMRLS